MRPFVHIDRVWLEGPEAVARVVFERDRYREALERVRREAAKRDADGHRGAEDFLHWVKAEISDALKEES